MFEVKTTFKRMAFYYLLLAINIIPCGSIIPDIFPLRNLSTIYLLALSVCLVMYYAHRISQAQGIARMMKLLSWSILLMILLRGIKYAVFSELGFLARHAWYAYYAPMLLIPLLLFGISLLISNKEPSRISKLWYPVLALCVVLILLVLTNDIHQWVFKFRPGFADWDNDHAYGFLFYVITVCQYALYLAAIIILVMKCRITSSKRNAWIILIPFAIGIAMNLLLFTGNMPRLNGSYIIEFPEALMFMAAVVLECCIQLGLIPTNRDYGSLFRYFSISAQITDRSGAPVYLSSAATPLTREQFLLPDGSRIGEHTVLHRMRIPGGFGFWQDDMTELDRLNEELAEARDALEQEAELMRLKSELKEKQAKLEQRTLVYDTIATRTQRQSRQIMNLAKRARLSSDNALREDCRNRIALLGTYIKRYANLMLLSQEKGFIEAGELGLSVSEFLRHLNYCGISGELIQGAEGSLPADAALAVFEAFETLIEDNYTSLKGVFVNISSDKDVKFKIALETPLEKPTEALRDTLIKHSVTSDYVREDDVSYICFIMRKGGDAA